ncbi:hypothetical protein D3C72_1907690 [compost metagenome]
MSDSAMAPNAQRPTYVEEGRVALSVRLPREMHTRMRKLAIDRDCRVNDLYQEVLQVYLIERLPGEPFLRAPPTSATPVTLWLEPTFSDQFREALERRCLTATNVVVTALLHHFGEDHPTHDRLTLQTAA